MNEINDSPGMGPAQALPVKLEMSSAIAAMPVRSDMDPRLQRIVAMRRQGTRKAASSSTSVDEVAVVAKVSDVRAWEELSEVRVGTSVGTAAADGTFIVTGRIPISRVEHVRSQSFVRSLKAARPVTPTLNRTVPEIVADPAHAPAGSAANGGANAIVGIVDFGCDFAHKNFRDAALRSRVLAIWNQSGAPTASSPFGFGRLHVKAEIDAALTKRDPYAALSYGPARDRPGLPPGTHGTHVMDIAAGNGLGSGTPGVAPAANILFVDLASTDVPWEGPEVVGKSFGDSVQLLEAVRFIFDRAGETPCVVNLSLGTNGGPHDGSTLVEQGFDRLVSQQLNRAIVLAASNSFTDGIHARGVVPAGGVVDLPWLIPNNDGTSNEMEVWYAGADRFTLEVIAPDGSTVAEVRPGENKSLTFNNRVVMFLANRLDDPNNGDNMIGLFLEPELPAGRWIVRLRGDSVTNGTFHAWIERDDNGQSSFVAPLDNSHTLGSISCGKETIVVGSYDAHKAALPMSFFSSAGPTRDGREKPEICAPGHAVLAAHSRTLTGVTPKSGTSMAAPAVTGVVALMLSEAAARGKKLTITDIRQILRQSVRPHPVQGTAIWDPRTGAGRVGASEAVRMVTQLPTPELGIANVTVLGVSPHRKRRKGVPKAEPVRRPTLTTTAARQPGSVRARGARTK
jgi:subtilisin family serine protease